MSTDKTTLKTGKRTNVTSYEDVIELLNKKIKVVKTESKTYLYVEEYKRKSNRDFELARMAADGSGIEFVEENWQKVRTKLRQLKSAGVISASELNKHLKNIETTKVKLTSLNKLHRRGGMESFDITSLKSALSTGKAARFLYNMGLSPEQIAEEYNINVNDILDDSNWSQDTWVGITKDGSGLMLKFTWGYNGMSQIDAIHLDF